MSSVLNFPTERSAVANLSPNGLMCKCRIAARIAGCNQTQRMAIERAVRVAIEAGGENWAIYTAAQKTIAAVLQYAKAPA